MNPLETTQRLGEKSHNYVTQILKNLDALNTKKAIHLNSLGQEENNNEDTNPIIGIYRKHFIFMFKEWFSILLLTTFFALLIYFVAKFLDLNTYFSIFLTVIMVTPLLMRTFLTHVVDWQANAIIFRKKNLVLYKYKGVFTQSTEVRSISQIKSFDIIQSGIFQQFLNYGDIEVASMISGASKKIVLKNIYPIKEAYEVLSQHIESLEEERKNRNNSLENGSDIPNEAFDESEDSDDE